MIKLFKTLINNGFVVLGLLIAVTLYLAYSQKPQPLHKAESVEHPPTDTSHTATPAETTAPAVSEENQLAALVPEETPPAEQNTGENSENTPAPLPAEADENASLTETDQSEPAQPAPEAPAVTPEAADMQVAQAEAPAEKPSVSADENKPAPSTAESAQTPAAAPAQPSEKPMIPQPESENTPEAAEADTKAEPAVMASGLLFDPAKLDPRAILSSFPNAQAALAEAERARKAGDLNWAAAIYAALLHYYPRSELAGTLGNLFWQLGDKTWAHRAWRYAAQLLIKEGHPEIAARFADNIEKLDPALSQEIRTHLPQKKTEKTH